MKNVQSRNYGNCVTHRYFLIALVLKNVVGILRNIQAQASTTKKQEP